MPAFRELCPEQVLRPGDDVTIGQVSILFSDLKGSTALYAEIGDGTAYGLVRDHFAFMAERIRGHRGVLVKTMGDAVMAAFAEPADVLATALSVQRDVATFNAEYGPAALVVKFGMHRGECIAVNTAGVLDYFGTTVNIAARLQEVESWRRHRAVGRHHGRPRDGGGTRRHRSAAGLRHPSRHTGANDVLPHPRRGNRRSRGRLAGATRPRRYWRLARRLESGEAASSPSSRARVSSKRASSAPASFFPLGSLRLIGLVWRPATSTS